MEVKDLASKDLLEQYADMVRFNHYDPMGATRPSSFSADELEAEILRRLRAAMPEEEEKEEGE